MNRLKAFRFIEGLTQQDLSELLQVSPQLISAVENGSRDLTFDISKTGYSPSRFQLPDMSEPLHRQRSATSVASTNRAKELLRLAGEVFVALRRRQPNPPALLIDRWPTPESDAAVEKSAADVRWLLGIEESGPVRDLTAHVERAGVCLVPLTGLKGIDGMSAWIGDQPVIGISPLVPGDRFRFSLSHEMAHLMLHRHKTEIAEDQANRFAGALLFPEPDIDAAFPDNPTLRDFVTLKKNWGVSVAALVYRAHELGRIDDRRYRSIQIQMSKWRKSEPGEFSLVPGSLLPKLVEIEGGAEAVSNELGLRVQHVREVVNWSRLRAA